MVMPGTRCIRLETLREVGRSFSSSPRNTVTCRALCTSTVGAGAATVIVSARLPTVILASTGAVNPVESTMFSRRNVLNEASVKVTV
jgi:hypothetical protein